LSFPFQKTFIAGLGLKVKIYFLKVDHNLTEYLEVSILKGNTIPREGIPVITFTALSHENITMTVKSLELLIIGIIKKIVAIKTETLYHRRTITSLEQLGQLKPSAPSGPPP